MTLFPSRCFRHRLHRIFIGITVLVTATAAIACQVPVFRYALERWKSDQYRFLVLSDSELDDESKAALKALPNASKKSDAPAYSFHDVRNTDDVFVRRLWTQFGKPNKRLMISLYPGQSSIPSDQVASVTTLTTENAQQVADSPARREIVKRLSEGHAAVWILLESGDEAKDHAALTTLEQQLADDAELLKLPTPEEMEIEPQRLTSAKVPLRIVFSVLRVKKNDPQESFLVDCLLNSEDDLREFQEPIAFPVFGRGRVLYALIGEGIAAATIQKASSFIVGPCSCQVKEQNPGFDLLLQGDWDAIVGTTLISDAIPEDGDEPRLLKIPAGRPKP
jgi:hypothetical protein